MQVITQALSLEYTHQEHLGGVDGFQCYSQICLWLQPQVKFGISDQFVVSSYFQSVVLTLCCLFLRLLVRQQLSHPVQTTTEKVVLNKPAETLQVETFQTLTATTSNNSCRVEKSKGHAFMILVRIIDCKKISMDLGLCFPNVNIT